MPERACLAALRELVGAPDGPIERHSARVFLLGGGFGRELLLCAAWHHDAGLYRRSAVASQRGRGVEVELLRRADLVGLSRGLVRLGIPRARIAAVSGRVPRDGFVPEVMRRLVARERPRTFWRMFRP